MAEIRTQAEESRDAILLGSEFGPYKAVLEGKLETGWNVKCMSEHRSDSARESFGSARAIISVAYDFDFPPAPRLELMQVPGAGLDKVVQESVPPQAAICNAAGHQVGIAEYCILGMLVCAHKLIEMDRKFRSGDWLWSKGATFPTHDEIFGKTVCVVGLGNIGQEVCRRAMAMGMRVLACTRSGRTDLEGIHAGAYEDLRDFAARSDYFVFCCPLSEETRGIADAGLFEAMRPTAVVINVSRGPVIEERALFDALRERRIAAAVLDVWYRYPDDGDPAPRPSSFPFHDLDNVVMTPHLSAWTEGMVSRRWDEIASNLDNLARNAPLRNVVRSPTGAGDRRDTGET